MNASSYSLWIKGTQVTDANASDVLRDGGSVKYQSENSILTLNNVNINVASSAIIVSDMNLNIRLGGANNVLKSTGNQLPAISINNSYVTISPADNVLEECSLQAIQTTGNTYAIKLMGSSSLAVSDCRLIAEGVYGGICGNSAADDISLSITNSRVTAKGGTVGIGLIKNAPVLTGCHTSCTYSKNNYRKDGALAQTVEIYPDEYGISIKEINVTALNKKNVLRDAKKSVTFDPSSNTLTLNGATLYRTETTDNWPTIGIDSRSVNILLRGENAIGSMNGDCIRSVNGGNLTILSTSSTASLVLGASSKSGCAGIKASGTLTISNCKVTTAGYSGIMNDKGGDLVLENATLTAKGNGYAYQNISSVTYKNCHMSSPDKGYFDPEKMSIMTGNQYAKEVSVVRGKDNIKPTMPSLSQQPSYIAFPDDDYSCISVAWYPATDNCTIADDLIYTLTFEPQKEGHDTKVVTVKGINYCNVDCLDNNITYTLYMTVTDNEGNTSEYEQLDGVVHPLKLYPVVVNGRFLDQHNYNNIPVDRGSATYDYETNTLTLNNALIAADPEMEGIGNMVPLTINLIGNCEISTTGDNGIGTGDAFTTAGITIQTAPGYSSAKLRISTDANGMMLSGDYIIKNCDVTIVCNGASSLGIAGIQDSPLPANLSVQNANLYVKAAVATSGITSLDLQDVWIKTPDGGSFNTVTKRIEDKSGNAASEVYITNAPVPTSIGAIETEDAYTDIQNPYGMRVNSNYRGVVIINGKKHVKQ